MNGSAPKLFILVFLLSIVAGILILILRPAKQTASDSPEPPAMKSESLIDTVIVPSLADPLPKGKNVLWCASFQLAWDRLKKDVIGEPVLLEGADAVTASLNSTPFSESDLVPGSYYAAAGRGPEMVESIRRDMAKLFPGFKPDLKESPIEFVAYSYLKAGVKFDPPYFDAREPLAFQDGAGRVVPANAFGIRQEDEYAYYKLRDRVEIVFSQGDRDKVREMVIDPCRDSSPNQILLALIPKKETMKAMWEDVRSKLLPNGQGLGPNDTLLIPSLRCNLAQDFESLSGHPLLNPGFKGKTLDIVRQAIEFRLNRGGAELGSEAKIMALPVPTHYHFDRPFLVAMRKRGSSHPFLLMWVENREVLK